MKEKVTHLENKISIMEEQKGMLRDEMLNKKMEELKESHEENINEMREEYENKIQEIEATVETLRK